MEGERTILDTDATGSVQDTKDNILYADDFEYCGKEVIVIGRAGPSPATESYIESRGGPKGAIPRYTHDRNGAFEAYLDEETGNYVLRQQLDRDIMGLGGAWNPGEPVTAIGDFRWLNYKASVDVSFETNDTQNGANYAAIGARYQGGPSSHHIGGTPYVLKFWFDGGWQLLAHNQRGRQRQCGDGRRRRQNRRIRRFAQRLAQHRHPGGRKQNHGLPRRREAGDVHATRIRNCPAGWTSAPVITMSGSTT